MICEKCGEEHDGSYGSGRFCGKICAKSFSTSKTRDEINEKVSKKLGKYSKYITKEEVLNSISQTRSMREASIMLNIPYSTFKRLAVKYKAYEPKGGKWSSGLSAKSDNRIKFKGIPLEEVMIENSKYNRGHLKLRLLRDGLIKEKCEICGFEGLWNNKPITFILDHINGINNDHRLENLRMVCPMCNVQLDTFCSKNIKFQKENKPK